MHVEAPAYAVHLFPAAKAAFLPFLPNFLANSFVRIVFIRKFAQQSAKNAILFARSSAESRPRKVG